MIGLQTDTMHFCKGGQNQGQRGRDNGEKSNGYGNEAGKAARQKTLQNLYGWDHGDLAVSYRSCGRNRTSFPAKNRWIET